MPQTNLEYLRGYLYLTGDTLTQRLRLPTTPEAAVFSSKEHLSNQQIVVTGANTGIGYQTTRLLARAGATIILGCRNRARAESAMTALKGENDKAKLHFEQLDLSDMGSVRQFAKDVAAFVGGQGVDCLILNGGVMGVDRAVPETHFMVNHVGHALLTLLLLSITKRVIFVTSLTYRISDLHISDLSFSNRPYNWMTAYANSKLCMILFMHALKKRAPYAEIYGVHPGEATSDVARNLGRIWMGLHKNVGSLFLLTTEESARTSVYVAGMEKEANGFGLYERVSEPLHVPERFTREGDVEDLWQVTLKFAGISDDEVRQYLAPASKQSEPL